MRFGTYISILVCSLAVIGCGSGGPSIAGTWTGVFQGQPVTLTANADSSFTSKGMGNFQGRWEVQGSEVKLFKDVRNGGDASFGAGGDGSFHLELDPSQKEMIGKLNDNGTLDLKKK